LEHEVRAFVVASDENLGDIELQIEQQSRELLRAARRDQRLGWSGSSDAIIWRRSRTTPDASSAQDSRATLGQPSIGAGRRAFAGRLAAEIRAKETGRVVGRYPVLSEP